MLGAPFFAAVAALAAGLSSGAPVQPTSARPVSPEFTMTFAVSPDEALQGTKITMAGKAGYGDTGNAAPVDIYFRTGEAAPYRKVTSTKASGSGRFSVTRTATVSGDYQAVYRGNKERGVASGSDYVAVYTTRTVQRLVYSWSGTRQQCQPVCRTHGPEQTLGDGPVHMSFRHDCGPTRSGGSIGFTGDRWNAHEPGDPGWRDFPDGVGPAEFDLAPADRTGHFYLTWVSTQREPGQATVCDLSFTAKQTAVEITYV